MEVGDIVMSNYKAKWKGIILSLEYRKDTTPLAKVRLLINKYGNKISHLKVNTIDTGWLSVVTDIKIIDMIKEMMEESC